MTGPWVSTLHSPHSPQRLPSILSSFLYYMLANCNRRGWRGTAVQQLIWLSVTATITTFSTTKTTMFFPLNVCLQSDYLWYNAAAAVHRSSVFFVFFSFFQLLPVTQWGWFALFALNKDEGQKNLGRILRILLEGLQSNRYEYIRWYSHSFF